MGSAMAEAARDGAAAKGPGDEPGGVTVVIPAYNEERGLGPVLEQLRAVLAAGDVPWEILVVDDGSTDGTAAAARGHDGVRVVAHRANRGYGAAVKTGIRRARHDVICITDADGTYPAEWIPKLAARVLGGEADMAVGARTGKNVAIPLVRRPAKWVIGKLANMAAGEPIPDINSGLRAFRRSTALRFFNLLPDGFSLTTTLTLAMATNGYAIEYEPIDYRARVGRSKIRPIRDTLAFFQLILRTALYFAPLRVFLPLASLLLLAAVGWALASRFLLGQLADVSTMVIAIGAVQVAVVGLLAELVNRRLPNYRRDEGRDP
jgi:glycosyltransferase involved in cell wall biosynthesis